MKTLALLAVAAFAAAAGAGAADLPELIVEAPPELSAVVHEVEAVDRRRLATAARLTGSRGPQAPIRVLLATEESAAARVPPWVSGYAYGARGQVVLLPERTPSYPDGSLDELLLHELTHVLVARAAGNRPVPRWFNEGLAMMAAGSWGLEDRTRLSLAIALRGEPTAAEIDALFGGQRGEVRRAYALAGALVRDLVRRHGRPVPRRVLAGLARGESFEEAFEEVTGTTLAASTRSFWRRHSLWYRWLPLLGSSFTLWLLIVALAGVAWWRKRRRVAILERQWAAEAEAIEASRSEDLRH